MDKKRLHHYWRYLRGLKTWYLLAAFLVSAFICVWALRQNNLIMIRLRDQVYAADKDNRDIEGALHRLRQHVAAHMNTGLLSGPNPIKPPIQLKYSYERAKSAEEQRQSDERSRILTDAQTDCERRFPSGFSGSNRLPCIRDYIDTHKVSERPVRIDFYTFDFVSPAWTPDLAGTTMLISAILGFLVGLRVLLYYTIRAKLKD